MSQEAEPRVLVRSPAKPAADTKRPIVANPSTPGVQTPNTPTGREAPPEGPTIRR
jgi:hypothetical protein